jgi:hypothetical protein
MTVVKGFRQNGSACASHVLEVLDLGLSWLTIREVLGIRLSSLPEVIVTDLALTILILSWRQGEIRLGQAE